MKSSDTLYVADYGNNRIRRIVGGNIFNVAGGGALWQETIRPLPDGSGIDRLFETPGDLSLELRQPEGASVVSSTGTPSIGRKHSASFTLVLRWK